MDLPVVEVDGLNGAFYTAYMKANHDGFVTLVFDNNLEQEIRVSASEVRLPPPSNCTKDIGVGDEVEVLLATSDQEPYGWWLAVVKMIHGQHYLIECTVNGAVHYMFTKGEYIRCRNTNSPGTSLPSSCSSAPEKRSDMQDAPKQLEVAKPAEPERKEVSKSTTGATRKTATPKKDTAENGEVANCPQCEHKVTVRVKKHLMGLAIGTRGKNLQSAKRVPGVTDIVLPRGSCTFTIYGKTPEAVQQARAMLAFKEHCFYVPADVVYKVVGKSHAALEEITFNSGVQIRLDQNNTFPSLKGMVPYVVLGTEDKIKIACTQLEKRVTDFQAMERNM